MKHTTATLGSTNQNWRTLKHTTATPASQPEEQKASQRNCDRRRWPPADDVNTSTPYDISKGIYFFLKLETYLISILTGRRHDANDVKHTTSCTGYPKKEFPFKFFYNWTKTRAYSQRRVNSLFFSLSTENMHSIEYIKFPCCVFPLSRFGWVGAHRCTIYPCYLGMEIYAQT